VYQIHIKKWQAHGDNGWLDTGTNMLIFNIHIPTKAWAPLLPYRILANFAFVISTNM
jgi:hypothetical protein